MAEPVSTPSSAAPSATGIVAATDADLPAVAALAHVIWRRHYPPLIGSEQTEFMLARMYAPDALREWLAGPPAALELLRVNSRLVGFVAYGPSPTPGEFRLDKLYVHHDHHGAGHGRALIARAEAAARAHASAALVLNVHQRNAIAIRAYQRSGFVVRRAFANDFGNGRPMDDYEMAKTLARD